VRKSLFAATALVLAVPAYAAPSDEAALKKIEVRWGEAFVKRDTKAMTAFIAPEWTAQDSSAQRTTRAAMFADMESGKRVTSSFTPRDMHVIVMGDVAVVQGYDDEKSSFDGKDTSGSYSWTDVFQRRGGKWMAVATQSAKVAAP